MSSSNPFDFSQFFKPLDPEAVSRQWQEMLSSGGVPGIDMNAYYDTYRKNLEALAAANKAAMEGTQQILQRQAEMMQAALAEATEAARSLGQTHDPAQLADAQAKVFEAAIAKSMENAAEMSDLVRQTQDEAGKALVERFNASIEELKASVKA